jgi:hypothetical protein
MYALNTTFPGTTISQAIILLVVMLAPTTTDGGKSHIDSSATAPR